MCALKYDDAYVRELQLCVPIGPWDKQFKRDLKQFRHMHTRDEAEVKLVKVQASNTSLKCLKLLLLKRRQKLEDEDMTVPVMLYEESAEKFVYALTECHILTLHLLAHNFSENHPNTVTWFCPLSRQMYFWREKNGLLFLDEKHRCIKYHDPNICNFDLLTKGTHWGRHFKFKFAANSPYHTALKVYMEYCTEHLHKQICFTSFDDNTVGYTQPIAKSERTDMPDVSSKDDENDVVGTSKPPPYSRTSEKLSPTSTKPVTKSHSTDTSTSNPPPCSQTISVDDSDSSDGDQFLVDSSEIWTPEDPYVYACEANPDDDCDPAPANNKDEMGVDTIEVDEASVSACTTLSTHSSLKRKSTSPPSTYHPISNNVTPIDNTKRLALGNIPKEDYHLLFPPSGSDKKFDLVEIDCGPPYGKTPCRVWTADQRTISKIKIQGRRDYKFLWKKSKLDIESCTTECGMMDASKLDTDQRQRQIYLGNIHLKNKNDGPTEKPDEIIIQAEKESPNKTCDLMKARNRTLCSGWSNINEKLDPFFIDGSGVELTAERWKHLMYECYSQNNQKPGHHKEYLNHNIPRYVPWQCYIPPKCSFIRFMNKAIKSLVLKICFLSGNVHTRTKTVTS